MSIKIHLDKKTEDKRNTLWGKYGKVTNRRREHLGTFDFKIYNMGLAALEVRETMKNLIDK